MNLNTILKQIAIHKPNAELELDMGNINTYRARLGQKRAAEESILRLERDYKNQLLQSTAFILVTGSSKDAFVELASDPKFESFTANPEALFNEIAEQVSPPTVKPSLYGREGVKSLFSIAQNVFRDKATDIGVVEYPSFAFNDRYNVGINTKEEFAQLLKTAIVDQVGSEIVGIHAVNSIADKAIERGHTGSVTPIILGTSDERFALNLLENLKKLKAKTFLVSAGKVSKTIQGNSGTVVVKNVTEENVADALVTIKNKI